jgi:hypothetical protein
VTVLDRVRAGLPHGQQHVIGLVFAERAVRQPLLCPVPDLGEPVGFRRKL